MTELRLINTLALRLEDIFKGYTLPNKAKLPQQVKVFRQYLPQSTGMTTGGKPGIGSYDDTDYESNFPCIIVKYLNHTDKEERRLDQSITNVKVIYGIYDEAPECQGYCDILDMMDKTRMDLLRERIVGGVFMLDMPVTTRLLEAETWPVYFGEMSLRFVTGRPIMGKDYIHKGAVRE